MKKFVLILIMLSVANLAFAQIPSEPNQINVYFDLDNYMSDISAPLYTIVPCYLVLTNPTAPSIGGWECELSWDLYMGAVLGPWNYAGEALNVLEPLAFAVGLAEPLPASEAVLLLDWTLFMMAEDCLRISVLASPEPSLPGNMPAYLNGDDLEEVIHLGDPCGYDPDGIPEPCSSINCGSPVTESSWSSMKALYR